MCCYFESEALISGKSKYVSMDNYSYSRISGYFICARKFWYQYIAKIKGDRKIFSNDALILGQSCHCCAQEGVEKGIEFYEKQFNKLNSNHVNEELKLRIVGKPLYEMFGSHQHEVKITSDDGYVGYIDDYDPETCTVSDFKYSNSIEHYLQSPQIHLYKYFGEQNGLKIDHLQYVFIPKIAIRQKKTETIEQFRDRIFNTLSEKEIQIIPVEYDEEKVKRFLLQKDLVFEIANNHPDEIDFYKCDEKRRFCRTCEYLSICEMQKYNDDVYDEHIDFEGNEKYLSYLEDAEDERLQKLNQMV